MKKILFYPLCLLLLSIVNSCKKNNIDNVDGGNILGNVYVAGEELDYPVLWKNGVVSRLGNYSGIAYSVFYN